LSRASIFPVLKQVKFLLLALTVVTAGCSLEKQSGFNRTLQNLTAHYNILFNANELLRLKQESYALAYVDNYNEILSVYQDTIAQSTTPDKDLEAATAKANTIITFKEQSHYLGDAYLILGKTSFLGGTYFNASEYFSYVIRSFPKQPDLKQEALAWKARSLMYLGQMPEAKISLDSAIKNINQKKRNPVDVYAAKLQYDINTQDYVDGEEMAKQAIHYTHDKKKELRWRFILGQLQELNQKPADAIVNYNRIAKSNASFEMAFNASLNRIRIEDKQNGVKISRIDRLLSLLKDPNNKEFKDQIYYQVAELQMADKNINGAIKNYNLSIRYSLKNQTQKGLAYLRLAGISFKNRGDYLTAKKYYDSTLTTLSPNYPGYHTIQKLSTNLQVLTDRLLVITREDTLQALARMDEKTRLAIVDKMVSDRTLQQQTAFNNPVTNVANANNTNTDTQAGMIVGNSFYFYNTNAVSQGFIDFKRRWGNRGLTDNWRRSDRSSSDLSTNEVISSTQNIDPDAPVNGVQQDKNLIPAGSFRQTLLHDMPLTTAMLAQSNDRIYNAYMDIGNFYRDVLSDKKEATTNYETILRRYPAHANTPAVYYNLYRLYSDLDSVKSNWYKNILLKNYPNTPFAKVISDPDYVKKLEDENAEFTVAYNNLFDLYVHKKYKEVIDHTPALLKQYPDNKFLPQIYYLQAISAGHNEGVIPFRDSLQQIIKKFPEDRLIIPVVNQHLAYINTNLAELMTRPVVLTDDDPNKVPFTFTPEYQQQTEYRKPIVPDNAVAKQDVKVPEKKTVAIAAVPTTATANQPVQLPVKQTETLSTIFSMGDSTNYYFVVNVSTTATNVSSSRFGIGQFNRANYPGKGIKHQLMPVGTDNQLIFVGRFTTLSGVKKYAAEIIPLMPEIMKVPKDKYSFFIITQENLNKLADKKTLDSYIDYYQKNY
jgi:tetratricopeptide (TPR) repeat protein